MLAKGLTGPDQPHKRTQKDARHLLGALRAPDVLPLSGSMRSLEYGTTYNQLSCSGCTAHAGSSGIFLSLKGQGVADPILPSPRFGYALDRLQGGQRAPLTDTGAELADYVSACKDWGVVPIDLGALNPGGFTDVTPANVNDVPAVPDLIKAARRMIVGEYRIDLTAADAVSTARELLTGNVPLYVGGFVDSAFENYTLGAAPVGPPNQADPNGGGHAMVVVGYKTSADGLRLFEVLSSWGAGWGDAGHAWVTEGWFLALWDCYAFTCREVYS